MSSSVFSSSVNSWCSASALSNSSAPGKSILFLPFFSLESFIFKIIAIIINITKTAAIAAFIMISLPQVDGFNQLNSSTVPWSSNVTFLFTVI